eukprot:CAMPEP_0170334878 /NCGR_PEP_ID=MMETSP0116_2-20130129/68475_1 /TAXON_ID=400756 /ORGANISM="Durinskia baltica, Strain CSIRO CS-38" /LENGTH=270 /DNA_ID=CAMNT_0010588253 /DNA_START=67 /DNA_END=876 /DNA_ORIENTATION=+
MTRWACRPAALLVAACCLFLASGEATPSHTRDFATDIIYEHAPFAVFSRWVWETALKMNLPFWGTCLGFEQMLLYSSGEQFPGPLTEGWHSMEKFMPLNFSEPLPEGSMFADWPESVKSAAAGNPWTWHAHTLAVSTEDFAKRPAVRDFWQVLATNVDGRGKEFVSVVQARNGLPFFATQFHPEKNANEFEIPFTPSGFTGSLPAHSAGAIDVMNRLGAFFVDQARGFRGFAFNPVEFWAASISNWNPRRPTGIPGFEVFPPHEQLYVFP